MIREIRFRRILRRIAPRFVARTPRFVACDAGAYCAMQRISCRLPPTLDKMTICKAVGAPVVMASLAGRRVG